MEQKNNSNGFNLFLFGIVIGVIITLLLVTKKGKKILKTITDEGIEKISSMDDLLGKVNKAVSEEEYVDDGPVIGEEISPKKILRQAEDKLDAVHDVVEPVIKKAEKIEIDEVLEPKKRRLFKGIRRN